MVDVEKLSDAELRTKLMEFGFPVMPITGTTRNLMVKKLRLLLENKNKTSNDGRRSLGRYSSEEESDTDVRTTRKDKNRRATMAAPAAHSPSRTGVTLRKSMRRNDSEELDGASPPVGKDVVRTTKRTTTTKIIKSVQDEFDTGSDSEPEIIEDNFDSSPQQSNNSYKRDTPHSSFSPSSLLNYQSSASKYSRPQTVTSSAGFASSYSSSFSEKPILSSRFTSYNSPSSNSDAALDRLNQIRSRLSLGSTGYDRNSSYSSAENTEEKAETPFLSNFTRRLSQLSSNASSPKPEYEFKNDIIKEHDTNGAGGYSRGFTNLGRSTRFRDINRDYYSRHNSGILKNNLIPFCLVGVACLFFIVVAVMYYGMRSNDNALEAAGYFIPRCISSDSEAKPGVNCIYDSDIEGAINLMKMIKPELIRQAVGFACNDPNAKPFLTELEIINYHSKLSGQDKRQVQKHLEHMEVLAFKNPDWAISLVKTDGDDFGEGSVFENMDELIAYRMSKKPAGLAVLHPEIPWRCSLYNKMYAIFNSLIVLFATFFLLYFCNYGYKCFKNYQQQKKDEVYNIIERIVDTLQANNSEGNNDFLVINHVRDMILPINDRKRMEKTWEEAVKFINDNESRIRTEVQVVQGEPFEVWRWLGSPSLNTSGSPRSKTWQGQAFETQVGSVNSLPCSPTPCLKVRGMVDDNDRNFHAIREAVLSKCAHQCRILHCAVDNTSKCVYLKCADQNDAAISYRNLHGWWYAGHLVTVKYLRLERYMQRFPDSPVSGPPFLKAVSPATDWSS